MNTKDLKSLLDAEFTDAALRGIDYPRLPSILGSDWIVGRGWQGGDPARYRELAYEAAAEREGDKRGLPMGFGRPDIAKRGRHG